MKNFVIKKMNKKLNVDTFSYDISGFNYKIKNSNFLEVKEIVMVSPEIIDKLITNSFNRKYKKILAMFVNSNEEDTNGALMRALDEIARLKSILLKKYGTQLSKEVLKKLLKQLKILEKEVQNKIIEFTLIKEQQLVNTKEEEISKSR